MTSTCSIRTSLLNSYSGCPPISTCRYAIPIRSLFLFLLEANPQRAGTAQNHLRALLQPERFFRRNLLPIQDRSVGAIHVNEKQLIALPMDFTVEPGDHPVRVAKDDFVLGFAVLRDRADVRHLLIELEAL